ncbi:MAG: hypothetical protein K1X74_19350 [Pirellulales bacterium]|nr:hypothetical protein [Pirellulales bacterium]
MKDSVLVVASIGLTVLCWGLYGPLLHNGQVGMSGSRLRPLLCVGIAYFIIAVVVPIAVLMTRGEQGHWTFSGTSWSLLAGTAGAVGALGIILAFNYGGKPAYVMPMVFGFAPLINAMFSFATKGLNRNEPMLLGMHLAGLLLVGIGAFLVLTTATRLVPHGPKPAAAAPEASNAAQPTDTSAH